MRASITLILALCVAGCTAPMGFQAAAQEQPENATLQILGAFEDLAVQVGELAEDVEEQRDEEGELPWVPILTAAGATVAAIGESQRRQSKLNAERNESRKDQLGEMQRNIENAVVAKIAAAGKPAT